MGGRVGAPFAFHLSEGQPFSSRMRGRAVWRFGGGGLVLWSKSHVQVLLGVRPKTRRSQTPVVLAKSRFMLAEISDFHPSFCSTAE